jgi:diguanylate cyclase (GGDEF)-like protein/PAS domain S-box-containing protein
MPEPTNASHRALFDRTLSGISLESLGGRILYANGALARMLGYASASMLEGQRAESLFFDPEDAERHRHAVLTTGSCCDELRLMTRDGGFVWVMASTVATGDPVTGDLEILRTVIDITSQKASRERLEQDAYHDPLTGLPNRRLLRIRAEQALAMAMRRREQAALLFLDLVGFKGVNDHLGHRAGDALLEQVGRRIESALRTADIAARQGGDEFVVLLADVDGLAGARVAAQRLGGHLSKTPYLLAERSVKLEARFGVAVFPDHSEDLDGLLTKADQALAEAKREGGPAIRIAPQNSPSPGGGSVQRGREASEERERARRF